MSSPRLTLPQSMFSLNKNFWLKIKSLSIRKKVFPSPPKKNVHFFWGGEGKRICGLLRTVIFKVSSEFFRIIFCQSQLLKNTEKIYFLISILSKIKQMDQKFCALFINIEMQKKIKKNLVHLSSRNTLKTATESLTVIRHFFA